uniref:Uncharacterized protein n=1 Tax=Acrobeloides nanus TaxID=290746 RepID=A0A914EC34_9BILA
MNEGLANRKSLRISRRPSRLSIPVLIQPVRNVENENPLEPAIHETMAQLVDMVVNQELQKKRAERRKFCREVIRYDPITPKVTRSGRKFANRTSVLFKKRQRLIRKSIRNQQSIQSTATAENVPEQTALEEKVPRFEPREVENQNLAQENAELVEEAPVQLNGSPVVLVVQIRLSLEAQIEKENAKILEIEAERLKLAEYSATQKLVEEVAEVENTEEMKEEKQNMIAVRRPRRNSMYPKMSINAVLEQEQLLAQVERENRKNRKRKSLAPNQIPIEVNQIIQAQDEPSTSKAPGAEINIVSREDEILEAPEPHQSNDGIIETIEDIPMENKGENLENIENPVEEGNKPAEVLILANEMNQRRGRRRNSIYPRELLKTASIENLNEMVAENENDDQPEPEMLIELKNVNSDRKGKNKKNKKKRKEKRGSGEDQAENSENTPEAFVTDRKKNRKKRVIPEEDYHPSLKLPAPASILKKEQLDTPKKRKNAVHWADDNNDAPLHAERRISDVPDEYRFRKSTYRSSNFYPDPY